MFETVKKNLEANGFTVSVFASGEEAAALLEGPWPRRSKRRRWLSSLVIHWASLAAHSGCRE